MFIAKRLLLASIISELSFVAACRTQEKNELKDQQSDLLRDAAPLPRLPLAAKSPIGRRGGIPTLAFQGGKSGVWQLLS